MIRWSSINYQLLIIKAYASQFICVASDQASRLGWQVYTYLNVMTVDNKGSTFR